MAQDPKNEKVTARVIFVGVMFGCINTNEEGNKRYEIGMIICPPGHIPEISIQKGDAEPKPFYWPEGHDLIFRAVNPKEKGIRPYLPDPGDDPEKQTFNSVIDMEGPDLHNTGIRVNTDLLDGRRIGVTDGLLYTHELTSLLDLNTWTEANPRNSFVKTFGQIARKVGLNIDCLVGETNGIEILDAVTGARLEWLPSLEGVSYAIEVNNDCNRTPNGSARATAPGTRPPGSDFRLNYQVISPTDPEEKRRFDLEIKVLPGVRPEPNPDPCNPGGGSRTTSIGFKWPPRPPR